ncbi:MAG: sulfatase [Bacteroidota bacterium]
MKVFTKIIIGILFLIAACTGSTSEGTTDKPNFIIIIADDAAWDDNEAYGHPTIKTPNIGRLAREGLRFDNAFLTISSCSPSRSSIMSGLYPHNTGAGELHMPLPKERIIFPGELKKLGYYTASAGKWHLGPERAGFDTIVGGGPSGCEHWVEVLQNRPKDKPFFLWLASYDPHRDYFPNTIPEPHAPQDVVVPPYLPDNDSTRKDLALYYDEISRLDSYIGEVMQELTKQGIDNNTMVVFMSDNGRPFPRAKTRLYDSGIKMPFIVRWPEKVTGGEITASMVSSIDIAPTLVELAGGAIPDTFQGVSFAPILENKYMKIRDYIVAEHNWHDYQAHERALRTESFLYIMNAFPSLTASPPADAVNSITYQEMIRLFEEGKLNENQKDCFLVPRPPEELYDVVEDPFQLNNLAGDSAYFEELNQMREILNFWMEKTKDEVPLNPTPDKFNRWTGQKIN